MAQSGGDYSRWKELLTERMKLLQVYHNHKGKMAHAALLLNLALVAAFISSEDPILKWVGEDPHVRCSAGFAILLHWFLIHVYIRWQLLNRRFAALAMNAIIRVLRNWANNPPKSIDESEDEGPIIKPTLFDRMLFPPRSPQAQARLGDEGYKGYPKELISILKEGQTYAVSAERVVTFGSISLGIFLIFRLFVALGLLELTS